VRRQTPITRRRFLALAGGTVGVTTLACCGLTALGTQQLDVKFIESSCGGGNEMSEKILIAYASKCGSTGEVAEAIGEVWCDSGAAVDVRQVKEVTDVSAYRAVVVGSAVRMRRWLPEAVKFVETHRDALSQVPVAYFTVCIKMKDDTEENSRKVAAYSAPVREMVQPVDVGLFAGAIDYDKLPFVYRMLIKAMKVPEGDFRDWAAISGWAANVRPALVSV
jgi:menaquinone-dependent protoporphyrinogen oxidase